MSGYKQTYEAIRLATKTLMSVMETTHARALREVAREEEGGDDMSDKADELARARAAIRTAAEDLSETIAATAPKKKDASETVGKHDYCRDCVYRGLEDLCDDCEGAPPNRWEGVQ